MTHIFANWKMYINLDESVDLAEDLAREEFSDDLNVAIFPNPIAFSEIQKELEDQMSVGAQNVAWTPRGAYTGATSAHIYEEAGAEYALVGHSERRHIFGETDADVKRKIESCLDAGIRPVLCIGETEKDKEQGDRELILDEQLSCVFEDLGVGIDDVIVAYEPVWAISGSGESHACKPETVEEIHEWIKKKVENMTGEEGVEVIYGGSVEKGNVVSYTSLKSVDGILAGHASASKKEFLPLIRAVEK